MDRRISTSTPAAGGGPGSRAGPAVRVRIAASRSLAALIVAIHCAAGAAVAAGGFPLQLKIALLAVMAVVCWRSLEDSALRTARASVVCVERLPSGVWRISRRDGAEETARFAGVDYLHPRLVCLRLDIDTPERPAVRRGLCRVVIAADATTPASHRRLRVLLKTQGG